MGVPLQHENETAWNGAPPFTLSDPVLRSESCPQSVNRNFRDNGIWMDMPAGPGIWWSLGRLNCPSFCRASRNVSWESRSAGFHSHGRGRERGGIPETDSPGEGLKGAEAAV